MKIATAHEMREIDKATIEWFGLPGVALMENAGRAYTREQLLETVWGYDYEGGTRTVDVHVQTLRTKLGNSGRFVETVRGVGYRFVE